MTSPLKLTAALGNFPHVAALKDSRVTIPGVELHQVEVAEQVDIWRRMSRSVEFDISLMSMVSYLCAIEYDVPFTCLPISLNPAFHHGDFLVNTDKGIRSPEDLAGKRIGTRTWGVTPGTLDRGILTDEFGIDWRSITWVLAEPEHVPQAQDRLPPNVIAGRGENLFPRLTSGDLDAGIAGSNLQRQEAANVAPLFPNAQELDRAQFRRTGILQPFLIVAVKDEAIDSHPGLLDAVWEAFNAAKRMTPSERLPDLSGIIGDEDPIPYGLDVNRAGIDEAIRLAREYEIITKPMTADEIFPDYN